MTVQLTKDSIDLGIVVKDIEPALTFYRDTLGFDLVADNDMPGGMHMWRLMCGSSMIKLVTLPKGPKADAPPGGIAGGSGYRYWTISVSNLDELVAACEKGGYKIAVPKTAVRADATIAIVEDPEGNWVEFLASS